MKPPLPMGSESALPPALTAPSGPVERNMIPLSLAFNGGHTRLPHLNSARRRTLQNSRFEIKDPQTSPLMRIAGSPSSVTIEYTPFGSLSMPSAGSRLDGLPR